MLFKTDENKETKKVKLEVSKCVAQLGLDKETSIYQLKLLRSKVYQ